MDFQIIDFSSNLVFNYFFSLAVYYGLLTLIPTAIISIFRN
jgi:hypothetical protein